MASKCMMCGAPMEDNSCGYCGFKEKANPSPTPVSAQMGQPFAQPQVIIHNQPVSSYETPRVSKKNKMVALLLCIFLGVLGVHRFYVGKVGTGIIYLFTGGLFGIGWFIDVLLIATGSFKDKFDLPMSW